MANKESKPKKRRIRPTETVRQKAETASKAKETTKPRRLKRTLNSASKPFKAAHKVGKKEVYIPMPDNKPGRFLNKRRHIIPRYFRESFQELKKVTWPNRKQTTQLTLAVFIFAISFGVLISIIDYGLDRIFRAILIK